MFAVIVMVIIVVIIMMPIVVPAMFAADIMAVNPVPVGTVPWNPNHFPVACPIAGAMVVIRPIAYFDAKALRSNGGRQKNTGRADSDEQKFFRNHVTDSHLSGQVRPLRN
jgi:hypothetical protein